RGSRQRRRGSARQPRSGACSPAGLLTDLQGHAVLSIDLGQQDPDRLALGRGEILADVVGPDRQLTVAPVDQDRKLDGTRTADVAKRGEPSANRPARVKAR